jgi:fimbrial chaperone protein
MIRTLLASLAAVLAPLAAQSSSLHVAPVNVRLEAGQQAAALTLNNVGNRPLAAQVRVLVWTQTETEDQLAPQTEVVASPPLLTIPAQGEQLVRIVRLDHSSPQRELTYRLLIDELPQPGAADEGAVDIRIRYSVPLFVLPGKVALPPNLSFNLDQHDGRWWMKVNNAGGLHAQLSAVSLVRQDGVTLSLADGLLGYALAGSSRAWALPVDTLDPVQHLRLKAAVNGRAIDVALPAADVMAALHSR